jgi:hypothetical protein
MRSRNGGDGKYAAAMPQMKEHYTEEQVNELEERHSAVRAKRKQEACSKCKTANHAKHGTE